MFAESVYGIAILLSVKNGMIDYSMERENGERLRAILPAARSSPFRNAAKGITARKREGPLPSIRQKKPAGLRKTLARRTCAGVFGLEDIFRLRFRLGGHFLALFQELLRRMA